jgi:hypothetical protein
MPSAQDSGTPHRTRPGRTGGSSTRQPRSRSGSRNPRPRPRAPPARAPAHRTRGSRVGSARSPSWSIGAQRQADRGHPRHFTPHRRDPRPEHPDQARLHQPDPGRGLDRRAAQIRRPLKAVVAPLSRVLRSMWWTRLATMTIYKPSCARQRTYGVRAFRREQVRNAGRASGGNIESRGIQRPELSQNVLAHMRNWSRM